MSHCIYVTISYDSNSLPRRSRESYSLIRDTCFTRLSLSKSFFHLCLFSLVKLVRYSSLRRCESPSYKSAITFLHFFQAFSPRGDFIRFQRLLS